METTHLARRFLKHHPVTLREIVATPLIFRENVPGFEAEPFTATAAIKDLAEFAGFSRGALRTALSRFRASKELESFTDAQGAVRYRLSAMQRAVSDVVRGWQARPEGFIIGVFSFRTEQEAGRRLVRETLTYFGFKRIAQNTYINGMIDTAGLEAEMKRSGVAEHFSIFRCPSIDNPVLLERLKKLFRVTERARELAHFRGELEAFLEEPGIDPMDFGRRLFYAGPVHHRVCFVEEPPLPQSLLPSDYPLEELRAYFGGVIAARWGALISYYRTLCGGKPHKRPPARPQNGAARRRSKGDGHG